MRAVITADMSYQALNLVIPNSIIRGNPLKPPQEKEKDNEKTQCANTVSAYRGRGSKA